MRLWILPARNKSRQFEPEIQKDWPMTREYEDALEPVDAPLPPARRMGLIGHEAIEARLRRYLDTGQLRNGWMICGAKSIGKASLAYRIARAYLVPEALRYDNLSGDDAPTVDIQRPDMENNGTEGRIQAAAGSAMSRPAPLEVDETHPSVRQIVNRAHPDLFVLERIWQEKTNRLAPQITIDQLRQLSAFLALTASRGRRVVIIDAADDLNRNAANALLKSLEEPPAQTLILLVAHAPGKLLATLKSRCRKLVLTPVKDEKMRAFLHAEGTFISDGDRENQEANMDDILARAQGCPGYALALAGAEASRGSALAAEFFTGCLTRGNIEPLIERITAKAGLEEIWPHFERALLALVAQAARDCANSPQAGRTNPLPAANTANTANTATSAATSAATGEAASEAAGAGRRISSPPAIPAPGAILEPANAIHFARYWSALREHFSQAAGLHLDKAQLLRQIRIELGQLC